MSAIGAKLTSTQLRIVSQRRATETLAEVVGNRRTSEAPATIVLLISNPARPAVILLKILASYAKNITPNVTKEKLPCLIVEVILYRPIDSAALIWNVS